VAAAQRQAFVQSVAELLAATEGSFGDEGPRIGRALDAMSRALDHWERQRAPVDGRLLEEVARGMPLLPLAAYRRGFEQLGRGELRAAIEELRRAASVDALVTGAPSETHRVQGLVYWAESEPDKSIEQLEAAIRMHPGDERSRLALSRVLSAAGRDADAQRALLDTLRAIPASARAHWWLATSYEHVNRFADARHEFEQAASGAVAGRSYLFATVGRLASGAADGAGAVDALSRAVADDPASPAWHRLLAGALVLEDRPDDALAEFAAALRIDPRDAGAHFGMGQVYLNSGRNAEAAASLRRASELNAESIETEYALATVLTRLGNSRDAAPHFEHVEQVQAQRLADRRRMLSLDTLREEAALRASEHDHDRAAALWRQVIQLDPQRASDHAGLAAALAGAGRVDAAIEEYERAGTLGADPVVYRRLADLYVKAGRASDAARARGLFEAALRGGSTGR
jgi:tetratricopeptide (TPR) repeat protein